MGSVMRLFSSFIRDTRGAIQGLALIAVTGIPLGLGLAEFGNAQWLEYSFKSQTEKIALDLIEITSAFSNGQEPFESRAQMTATMRGWTEALIEGYVNPKLRPKLVSFAVSRSRSDKLRVAMQIEGYYESALTRMARIGTLKFVRNASAEKYVLCFPVGFPLDKKPEEPRSPAPNGVTSKQAKAELGKFQFDDEYLEEEDHNNPLYVAKCPRGKLPPFDRNTLIEAVRQSR